MRDIVKKLFIWQCHNLEGRFFFIGDKKKTPRCIWKNPEQREKEERTLPRLPVREVGIVGTEGWGILSIT